MQIWCKNIDCFVSSSQLTCRRQNQSNPLFASPQHYYYSSSLIFSGCCLCFPHYGTHWISCYVQNIWGGSKNVTKQERAGLTICQHLSFQWSICFFRRKASGWLLWRKRTEVPDKQNLHPRQEEGVLLFITTYILVIWTSSFCNKPEQKIVVDSE